MILAGKNENGDGAILVSFMYGFGIDFQVEIPFLDEYDVQVRVVDIDKSMDNAVFSKKGDVLTIRKPSYCAIYLIELLKKVD